MAWFSRHPRPDTVCSVVVQRDNGDAREVWQGASVGYQGIGFFPAVWRRRPERDDIEHLLYVNGELIGRQVSAAREKKARR